MKRRTFLFGSLAAGLDACTRVGGNDGARHNAFTIPGTLRFSDGEDVAGLNVHIAPQLAVAQLSQLTGGYLIRFDDASRPYPELIERIPSRANGDVSRDGLEITYRLRDRLRWSDGAPLTADDIVFSVEAVNNPRNNEYSRTGFDDVVDVGRRDARTATLKLRRPYGPFWETLLTSANTPLLPKHLLGGLPDINTAPFNDLPVGAGPFAFESWQRGDSVNMIANDRYFRGRPKLNRVIYKIVPDWNTVATQIETGELDLAFLAPANIAVRLSRVPGFRTIGQPGGVRSQLVFNTTHPAFADVRVRRALAIAVDRKTILDKVELGHGYLDDSYVGPLSPYAVAIPPPPFSLARAASLLDAAGWKLGADGVRAKNGTKLSVDLATIAGNSVRDQWLLLIQISWNRIGVKTTIKHFPTPVLFGAYHDGGILTTGKYAAAVLQQGYSVSGDLEAVLACDQIPPAGFNTVRLCDPALDRMMAQYDETYDPVAAKALDGRIQRAATADAPMVTLFIPQDLFIVNADAQGVGNFVNLDDARRWSI